MHDSLAFGDAWQPRSASSGYAGIPMARRLWKIWCEFHCRRRAADGISDSLAERSKAVAQGAIPKGRGFEPHSCHFLPSGPSKIRSRRPDSNLKAHIEKNKCTRRKTHRKDCYETIISLVIWGAYGHLADVISFVMRGLLIRLCIPGAARPHILHCPPPRLQNWPCFV